MRQLWSNLRFSLTLRIALHYAGQLLRTSFFALLIVSVCFILGLFPYYQNIHSQYKDLYQTQGSQAFLETASADPRLSSVDIVTSAQMREKDYGAFERFMTYTLNFNQLIQEQKLTFSIMLDTYDSMLLLTFHIQHLLMLYVSIFFAVLLADLYRMVSFVFRRKKLNKTVLRPLREISDIAATLSANNLSDRINADGTKNELKDLSTTINHMLDRIERSYNSQKQFVSDASHELRTPIAVIQGYVQMLNRWGKNDKDILDEGLHAIAQETESMKDLVENLLFLARHDKKTLLLEMEAF
ncbi:MAG: HAMP domain-containing protein, partial [Clostridiales bacterium]|nr:HAMP domain-containing protein [Clostridiales bacterium]